MKTDDLIAALARETEPAQSARPGARIAGALALGLAIAAGLLATAGFVRADLAMALGPVLAKAAFSAAFAAAALPALMRLARPGRPLGRALMALFALMLVSIVAAGVALVGVDPGERLRMLMGAGGVPWCVVSIPILALPAAGALFLFVRGLAPTSLAAAGAMIGAVSGGIGAMAYALYCPTDSVAFVATWYAVAIGLCAVIGALAGVRLLRW